MQPQDNNEEGLTVSVMVTFTRRELDEMRRDTLASNDIAAVKRSALNGLWLSRHHYGDAFRSAQGAQSRGVCDSQNQCGNGSNFETCHITREQSDRYCRNLGKLLVGSDYDGVEGEFWEYLVTHDFKNRDNVVITEANVSRTFGAWMDIRRKELRQEQVRKTEREAATTESFCRNVRRLSEVRED